MTERVLFAPGGATEAKQDTQVTALTAIQTALAALGTQVTLAQILAALQATQQVAVTNLPSDQLVHGSVTASLSSTDRAKLDAAATPATQAVSGTVAVSNQPSQPLTDTQLRAAPVDFVQKVGGVPVSGANPVPVAATFADSHGVPYSDANPLPVDIANLTVDQLNVSFPNSVDVWERTTNLTANESFTTPWVDTLPFAGVIIAALTSHASAAGGAIMEWSVDGSTVFSGPPFSMPPNEPLAFTLNPIARYFRFRYTNGPTATTIFQAQVLLTYQPSTLPIGLTGTPATDLGQAVYTAAAIKARNPVDGTYMPLTWYDGALVVGGTVSVAEPVTVDGTVAVSGSVEVANDSGNPIPVSGTVAVSNQPTPQTDALTNAQLRASAVPTTVNNFPATQAVSAAALPLPTGAATETSTAGIRTDLGTDGGTGPTSGTGVRGWLRSIRDVLAAGLGRTWTLGSGTDSVTVAGTVAVSNQPSQPLTDTQLRASAVPVSGPATDAQLRATPLPVSGSVSVSNLPATQPVSGSVAVSNFPSVQPVSGSVSAIDAAEVSGLLRVPFTISASGDNTVVTPTTGKAVRLRRLSPTLADPDGSSTPLLKLLLGTTEVARGYVLSGRFDVTGAVNDALVLNLSKAGAVSGTVFYELV